MANEKRPDAPLTHADEVEHRRQIAQRANVGLPYDGSRGMTQPLPLASFTVAGLPDAALWEGASVYVSDDPGIFFSNGTSWIKTSTYQGDWDASTGSFPSSPATGYVYRVSVPGTVDGVEFFWGDWIAYNGGNAAKVAGWTIQRSNHSLRIPQTTWLQRRAGGVIFYFDYPDFFGDGSSNGTFNRDEPTWSFRTFIEELKRQPHVDWIVVVNPNSGPGSSVDDQWTQAIEWLKGAGATVIGYVSTDFGGPYDPDNTGQSSLATEQDYIDLLDTWVSFYPEIDGFWLDEIPFYTDDDQSPPNAEADEARAFYQSMTQHAKLNLGKFFVGGNPGQEQFDDLYFQENLFDVLMTYEQETEPTESDLRGAITTEENPIRVYPPRKVIMPHNLNSGSQLTVDDIADRVVTNSQWIDYIFYWHDDNYGSGDAWDADNFQHHVRAVGEGWRRAYSRNESGGAETQSGDASTKVFTIAHGLLETPTEVNITPGTEDAADTFWVSDIDGTNIELTYTAAPSSATDNLVWYWQARL